MDTLKYVELIKNLLKKKGIQERNLASTMANILGIKYVSAKQKLDLKRGIKLCEIEKIHEYFHEELNKEIFHNAIYISENGIRKCNIEVKKIDDFNYKNKMVARKLDFIYIINMNIEIQENKDNLFEVVSINFLPAPVVAILDNDEEITQLLGSILSKNGIQSEQFTKADTIKKAIDSKKFDAYIIDWLLDRGETSDCIIRKIRDSNRDNTPIIILTGQINQHEIGISEMVLYYNVKIMEKPTKPKILIAFLEANLFRRNF